MTSFFNKTSCILGCCLTLSSTAYANGHFDVYDFDDFKLHVYYTADALNDSSFIIEGDNAVVTLEQPLFKVNVKEYDDYLSQLNKPVELRITDYHVGGTANHDIAMLKGMHKFSQEGIYNDMMTNFAKTFGDAIVDMPTGKVTEIDFDTDKKFAGISFAFSHGTKTDFPGADILIGNKVYYSHWAPAKAHANPLQISSINAVTAELKHAQKALNSGAKLFIGGHGKAASQDEVKFKIDYLTKLKEIFDNCATKESFVKEMITAFPDLPGTTELNAVADSLYK